MGGEKFSPRHARLFMCSQCFLVEMTVDGTTTTSTTVIPSEQGESRRVLEE